MRRAWLWLAAALAACEAPPVVHSADRAQEPSRGSIHGSVVYQGARRGRVVLLLYEAGAPPPPSGRGRPRSFTIVPREALFGAAPDGALGPFTAPYAFHQVPVGTWKIAALLDVDACGEAKPAGCRPSDWIPWFGATNEANAGDVAGGHVDVRTGALLDIALEQAQGRVDAEPARDKVVVLSDARAYPFDRPAFTVDGFSDGAATLGAEPIVLTLRATPLVSGPVDQRAPVFAVRLLDANTDGIPDDADGDSQPDLWPRVFVRKLADGDSRALTDENDLDRNGKLDLEGATYPHVDPSLDGPPALVVLAAGLNPAPLYPLLDADTDGQPDLSTMALVNTLQVVVKPLALDARDPTHPAPLRTVPPGDYALVVQQFTGQTWRVPNETWSAVAPAFDLPPLPGQGFRITVNP